MTAARRSSHSSLRLICMHKERSLESRLHVSSIENACLRHERNAFCMRKSFTAIIFPFLFQFSEVARERDHAIRMKREENSPIGTQRTWEMAKLSRAQYQAFIIHTIPTLLFQLQKKKLYDHSKTLAYSKIPASSACVSFYSFALITFPKIYFQFSPSLFCIYILMESKEFLQIFTYKIHLFWP